MPKFERALDVQRIERLFNGTGLWTQAGYHFFKPLADREQALGESSIGGDADGRVLYKVVVPAVAINDTVACGLAARIDSQYPHPGCAGLSRRTSRAAGALVEGRASQPAASISASGMSKFAATLATSS